MLELAGMNLADGEISTLSMAGSAGFSKGSDHYEGVRGRSPVIMATETGGRSRGCWREEMPRSIHAGQVVGQRQLVGATHVAGGAVSRVTREPYLVEKVRPVAEPVDGKVVCHLLSTVDPVDQSAEIDRLRRQLVLRTASYIRALGVVTHDAVIGILPTAAM